MTEEIEVVVPQEEEQQEEPLTLEEIEALKAKASVSSQNFERAKKAEEKAALLEQQLANSIPLITDDSDPYADKFNEFDRRFKKIEEEKDLAVLQVKYPAIKDKLTEFEEYKTQYPQVPMENVAKLFLAEHDLLGEAPKRKGLEKGGGGTRTVPKSDASMDEIKMLRTSNFREYAKQLREGRIK